MPLSPLLSYIDNHAPLTTTKEGNGEVHSSISGLSHCEVSNGHIGSLEMEEEVEEIA